MNLDNWQQYVKDNKLEADYEAEAGSYLVATLKVKCKEAYIYIMDEVEGSSSLRGICERLIDDDDTAKSNVKSLAANLLNSYIQYALDAIEDIEAEQDEQCCIELSKYERASNE